MSRNIPRYLLSVVALLSFVITSLMTMNNRTAAATGEQTLKSKPAAFLHSDRVAGLGGNLVSETLWGNLAMPAGIIRAGSQICLGIYWSSCNYTVIVGSLEPCKVLPITIEVSVQCGIDCSPYSIRVLGPEGNLVYVNPNGQFQATTFGFYEVTVTTADGCIVYGCGLPITPCCSLTQDEWGDNSISIRGESISQILEGIFTFSTTVYGGIPGRAIIFRPGSEACIIQRLPATGNIATLPRDLGDAVIDPSSCQTSPAMPLVNGKFKNTLLGQQIALSLNLFYSGGTPGRLGSSNLGSVHLCHIMVTQNPGPDGILGTEDDSIKTVRIAPSVLHALQRPGLDSTVDGLVRLADLALGGANDLGGVGLGDINNALDAINRAFDGCGFLIRCQPE